LPIDWAEADEDGLPSIANLQASLVPSEPAIPEVNLPTLAPVNGIEVPTTGPQHEDDGFTPTSRGGRGRGRSHRGDRGNTRGSGFRGERGGFYRGSRGGHRGGDRGSWYFLHSTNLSLHSQQHVGADLILRGVVAMNPAVVAEVVAAAEIEEGVCDWTDI